MDSTASSITLGWTEPLDDGGCPLTGYAVFRDGGSQGTPSIEVNSDSDTDVRGIPTLRSLVVTNLPSGQEGQSVRFSVRAFNREGHVDSYSYAAILFAAVPNAPPSPPVLVEEESSSTWITIGLIELSEADSSHSDV